LSDTEKKWLNIPRTKHQMPASINARKLISVGCLIGKDPI